MKYQIEENASACTADKADTCTTQVIFAYFQTREACNHLYKMSKKDVPFLALEPPTDSA